jgi:hypothetical protein
MKIPKLDIQIFTGPPPRPREGFSFTFDELGGEGDDPQPAAPGVVAVASDDKRRSFVANDVRRAG